MSAIQNVLITGLLATNAVTGVCLYKEHEAKKDLEETLDDLNAFASEKLGFDALDKMIEMNALAIAEVGKDIETGEQEPIQPKKGNKKAKPEKVQGEVIAPTPIPQA